MRLNQNENGGGAIENQFHDAEANLPVWERKPNKKQNQDLHQSLNMVSEAIGMLKEQTDKGLQCHKNELWRKIDQYYTGYRNELLADQIKKKETDEDPAVREKTLSEQLELMTHMAQELDKEHRRLQEQQQHLKIEYSSQESDGDLLIKQIIFY